MIPRIEIPTIPDIDIAMPNIVIPFHSDNQRPDAAHPRDTSRQSPRFTGPDLALNYKFNPQITQIHLCNLWILASDAVVV